MNSISRKRSLGVFLATIAVAVFAVNAGARSLHLALARAEPPKDSSVATPPKMLKLFFTEAVRTSTSAVKLTGPDSAVVELGPLTLGEGKIAPIVVPVKGVIKPGKQKVAWRTTGADGHALTGEYFFTVKAAASSKSGPAGHER